MKPNQFEEIDTCPHCQAKVGAHLEVHEVLVHPEKRERLWTDEYRRWKDEQMKAIKKSNRKKKD
jgi:hypothetical protein